jgi:predicted MPP superfamily phosphohydrolase
MENTGRKNNLLVIAACSMLLFIGWLLFETYALKVEHVNVVIPGLPEAFDGFRIVQISDLHGRRYSPHGKMVRETAAANPDVIALTGDYVHNSIGGVYNIRPMLDRLTELAPTYGVSGNHDHWTDWPYIAQQLQQSGVTLLENAFVRITRDNRQLILAGVGDPYTENDNLAAALPPDMDKTIVLLAHAPTWFEPNYSERYGKTAPFRRQRENLSRVVLTLVGHTHGGQVKLPFIGAVTTASGRLFPKTHVEGLIREEGGWLYISRGAGQGGFAFRFLSRPELTIITLRRTQP